MQLTGLHGLLEAAGTMRQYLPHVLCSCSPFCGGSCHIPATLVALAVLSRAANTQQAQMSDNSTLLPDIIAAPCVSYYSALYSLPLASPKRMLTTRLLLEATIPRGSSRRILFLRALTTAR